MRTLLMIIFLELTYNNEIPTLGEQFVQNFGVIMIVLCILYDLFVTYRTLCVVNQQINS